MAQGSSCFLLKPGPSLKINGTGSSPTLRETEPYFLGVLFGVWHGSHGLEGLPSLPMLQDSGVPQLDLGRSHTASLCLPDVLHSLDYAISRLCSGHQQTEAIMANHTTCFSTSRTSGQQAATTGKTPEVCG